MYLKLVENKMNQMKLLRELGDNVSLLPTYGKRKSPEKDQSISHELKIFDFQTIAAAANNFSTTNKLGEGGFGPVYKVGIYIHTYTLTHIYIY